MKSLMGAALAAAVLFGSADAHAQDAAPPTSDPLTACLIAKTSPADRTALMRWVFSMMTASPQVADLAQLTAAQRDAASKQTGALMTRLLTVDCRPQAVAEVKARGQKAIGDGFRVLGETAMAGLMNDPAVAKSMLGITAGADARALGELMIDAGVKPGK